VRSKCGRTTAENAVLRQHGRATHVIEAEGDLGFGATEALTRAVQTELDGTTRRLVLDLRRCGTVEPAVAKLLRAMAEQVVEAGAELVLAGLPRSLWGRVPAYEFVDVECALEWCENQVLRDAGIDEELAVPLAEVEILAGLGASTIEHIEVAARRVVLAPGEPAVVEGEPAGDVYLVLAGRVDVLLSHDGATERVSSLGPGTVFGEIGAVSGGLRSGTCVAAIATECLVIGWRVLRDICAHDPSVLDRLYTNLAMTLADRLRMADDERRALW